ncbi:MAG: hypothetical protein IM561_09025 [Microcystis sp. M60BS1]|uniref:hypothetical protein n=1 Tax=unclassified Microcystis TaxID=2643300 RepID=UPI00257FEA35|nr:MULTISPECIES: hypothetical protein [unclassified Microcystis]MCA2594366.1 hypothetical protein [Microcystis sp. M38BS1]MCA6581510.1 hypothetical protein [Pseudanabaena sp. M34BS1SP1A06MG]MCA2510511.1 hypothetical protein [Microcystis sp. M60BS1]MCA2555745.1 hypothetical protein [Microcystis sp. M43BS1]MCA2603426.1 hypothetical protein [Microcystis sp. M26BS1]
MSEAATEKKARRKPQGPRQTKPLFLIIDYTDEQGNPVKLDKARLTVRPTKDPTALVEMVTNDEGSLSTVVTVRLESENRPSPAA